MQELRIEMHKLGRIEMRRRTPDLLEGKFLRKRVQRIAQIDRIRRAGFGEIAGERERLDAILLAQRFDRHRAQPFRKRLAAGANKQREMCELGHGRTERLENLNLDRRVGDVILTPDDVRNRKIDVIDDRRQCVQKTSVLTDQYGIGQCRGVDLDLAAHEIAPDDPVLRQLEPPVRQAPLLFQTRALFR